MCGSSHDLYQVLQYFSQEGVDTMMLHRVKKQQEKLVEIKGIEGS